MSNIEYRSGDATAPEASGEVIIVHICNDVGAWGKGFVLALSRRWNEPERAFKQWYKEGTAFALGEVQFVRVGAHLRVANLIGQTGLRSRKGIPPIRYDAVESGLSKVAEEALASDASVHMPRIGCGLACGEWAEIERIVTKTLVEQDISVVVYDF